MSKIIEFPKMMYHKDGKDTRLVKSAEAQEELGKDWGEKPVHQFHGCQPAALPEKPVGQPPAEPPAKKKAKKKAKK